MKTFLFPIAAVLLIANCITYSQGYYPLQTGNQWQYHDYYDTSYGFNTKAIGDIILPNGYSYTIIANKGEIGDTEYFRQAGSKVYVYPNYEISEELWYDFSKTIGDTVSVNYLHFDTSIVTVENILSVNIFGRTLTEWEFYERRKVSSFYALRYVIDSIGLVFFQIEPGYQYILHGAVINGIKYGTVTDVGPEKSSLPKNYGLSANYPNPFNNSTQISYTLEKASNVSLKVYDLLGREVANLVQGRQAPGDHSVTWNADRVSSGVYFYRLTAGGFVQTKRMVLMK